MDDTLLKSDNTISQRNLFAIREFEKRGGVFMVNTGRMHASAVKRVGELGLDSATPVSAFQGAMISRFNGAELMFYKPLGYEMSLKVVEEAERLGIYAQIYDKNDFYFVPPAPGMPDYGRLYAERCGVEYKNVPSLSGHLRKTKMDCVKVLLMDEPEKVKGHLQYFGKMLGNSAIVNTSSPYMCEIFSAGAGKDVACDEICRLMGITIAQCMAIGDSMNDYTMIRHAGLGVAVSNALPEILKAAKYITDSNNDDGVAKAIERFCL